MSAPKDKPISLEGLTAAHKFLVDLTLYEEKEGEMYDPHLEYLGEIFYNHLSKENAEQASELFTKLNGFVQLAILDIERQAKQHLINHNKTIRK